MAAVLSLMLWSLAMVTQGGMLFFVPVKAAICSLLFCFFTPVFCINAVVERGPQVNLSIFRHRKSIIADFVNYSKNRLNAVSLLGL